MPFISRAFRWYLVDGLAFLWLLFRNYIYFFWNLYGISRHAKTLFAPWKRLMRVRTTRGLDFEDIFDVFSYNAVSAMMGAIIRSATIFWGIVMIVLFIVMWVGLAAAWAVTFVYFPLYYYYFSVTHPHLPKLYKSYQRSPALLVSAMQNDPRVREIFLRLGFDTGTRQQIFDLIVSGGENNQPSIDEEIIKQLYTKSALLVTLLSRELVRDEHAQLLITQRLSADDCRLLCDWVVEDDIKKYHDKQFWTIRKLSESRSIGKDWAFGYTPTIDRYATDVAIMGIDQLKFDIHQAVTTQVEQIFSRSSVGSVLLSGAPGTGKMTLVNFLAKRIYDGKTTPELADHRVMLLDVDAVLAASESAESKNFVFEKVLAEAHHAGNIILVIANVDRYLQNTQKGTNLSTVLSSVSGRYKVKILMTATQTNFKDVIRQDNLFLSSVHTIDLQPSSRDETIKLLLNLLPSFESKQKYFTFSAIKEIEKYAGYVYPNVPQPSCSVRALELVAKYSQNQVVTEVDVHALFSKQTNSMIGHLTSQQKDKLAMLEETLAATIVGQQHAIKQLASALKRANLELSGREKTMGAFLFLGATGVGKTETAKTLAKVFFGNLQHLIRIDCAQFVTESSLEALIGSTQNPTAGVLTEAVHKQPYSVVLLDEIEKAHRTVRLALMTIFDEGYLTNGKGEIISFKHSVVVATSNAGSDYLYQHLTEETSVEDMIAYLVQHDILRPEFINRFDGVVLYHPLSYDDVVEIAKRKLRLFTQKMLQEKGINLQISEETFQQVYHAGYSREFGARHLERAINLIVIDKVADALLRTEVSAGGTLVV